MKKLLLPVIFFTAFVCSAFAYEIVVSELPSQNRLPKSDVTLIFEDSEGYMWYGTNGGGLCRDDGYNVTVFRADFNTPNLMENNTITAITEDRNHRIWFGTKRGAYILDKKDYQIIPVDDEGVRTWVIDAIASTGDRSVWIAAGNNLYRYGNDSTIKKIYSFDWKKERKTVHKIYEAPDGTIWLLLWQRGILRYDSGQDLFVQEEWPFTEFPVDIRKDNLQPFYRIATREGSIVRFNPRENDPGRKFIKQEILLPPGESIPGEIIEIVQDSILNYLWVIGKDNMYVYETLGNNTLRKVETSSFLAGGKKMLNSITPGRNNKLWVAGFYPHSFVISFRKNEIVHNRMPCVLKTLEVPPIPITALYENGCYWFWQNRQYLCFYDLSGNEFSIYPDPDLMVYLEKSKSTTGVYTIKNNSEIKLIQHNGIHFTETAIYTYPVRENEKVRTLSEDYSGNLWIGTTYNLAKCNLRTKKFSIEWENTGIVNKIAVSDNGIVYLATEKNGFLVLLPGGEKVSVPLDENCMRAATGPGDIGYTGTIQGNVYCFDPADNSFIPLTKGTGLTGDAISEIATDRHGNVWIITDQRITIFDPEKGTTRIISSSDPSVLLSNFFSITGDNLGRMHVCGAGGIEVFPPDYSISGHAGKQALHFTSMKINGKNTEMAGYNTNTVILQPEERNIELFFSTLDPLEAAKARFAFRYKNQQNWNYLPEKQNSFYLTELSKGRHTLEIKSTGSNGVWADNSITVIIERLPAWYETWWAYTTYVLISSGIILLMIRKYFSYRKDKQDIKLEKEVAAIKYRFFTNISHELRTPLTLVITPLETIIRKITDKTTRGELESVRKNALNLLTLVNQLLDFRKMETGKESLNLAKSDINVFVHSVYENFRLTAEIKEIKFSFRTDVSGLSMYFDHDKLRKIMNNLLSNAIKFTDKGGKISVKLRLLPDNGRQYVAISVEDTGKGISKDDLHYIFERFQQADVTGNNTGSGIGLYLVKEYSIMHTGTTTAESTPGKGSIFTVKIPADLVADEGAETIITKGQSASAPDKKILIVEDNTEFRSYLKNELIRYYTVYTAKNGLEGERAAKEKNPDIVITDLMMPGIDGIELCRRIKSDIEISHIPVLLLTANSNTENEKRGYKEGADAYLSKPFDWDILLSRIEYLLQQEQRRKQLFTENIEVDPKTITISFPDEKLIKKALEAIQSNIDNPEYSVEELSRDMGMSRATFYRKIKNITGESPGDFLRAIRLKHAAELLTQGELTVAEVAYSVGFSTPSHFTQSFKKMFGILPNEYR